jgi:hypothetical protein
MGFGVIVRAERRRENIGRELLAAILSHPPLSGVSVSLLAGEGLIECYKCCGFGMRGEMEYPDGEVEALRFPTYPREESGAGVRGPTGSPVPRRVVSPQFRNPIFLVPASTRSGRG